MKPQSLNRIAELRHERKMNQAELAEAIGAHKITISKLERGEMRLTQEWMEKLSRALGVTSAEILSDFSLMRTVYVSGHLDNNMVFLEPGASIDSLQEIILELKVDYGVKEPSISYFFLVKTDIFAPAIRESDIVRFSSVVDLQSKIHSEALLGRICIAEIDEPHHMIIGVLERGPSPGTFDVRHPVGGYARGVRPINIYVLNLVLGMPAV